MHYPMEIQPKLGGIVPRAATCPVTRLRRHHTTPFKEQFSLAKQTATCTVRWSRGQTSIRHPPPPYGHTNAEPAESPASRPRATPSHRHRAFTHNNVSGIGLPHQLPIWYTHLHKRGMQSTSQLLHTRPAHTPPFRHTQHRITPSARKKQKITKIRENANTSAFHESQRNSNLFYWALLPETDVAPINEPKKQPPHNTTYIDKSFK